MARPEEKLFEFPIVGVGASAGGITAIQSLLQGMGERCFAAIVIIQHLPPGKPSGLSELLRKWTALPVHESLDGVRPMPGNVYLPAPHEVLTLENGVFRTRPVEGGERRPGIDTIDAFLESLARDRGPDAVAVVLSGTGMDGTAGAVRVRQAGGTVLVQDPASALHDGMPSSVIERGVADLVLPVSGIARELAAIGSPGYERRDTEALAHATSRALDQILALVRGQAGFDLTSYKPSPVLWRIQQRMNVRGTPHFADYEALLRDDAAELERLVSGLPIHVTEFFRDSEAWEVLQRDVIAKMEAARPLRMWTPACATGEEAYSLAMLIAERSGADEASADFQIFATDASPAVVARASRGIFDEKSLRGVSPARRQRFFYAADGSWRVKRTLRERMIFAPHDLLVDAPFAQLDLVTCRNLLIYLERDAIDQVLAVLHGALRVGGCLFLGRGEPLSPRQKGLEPVSAKWHIYRKTNARGPVRASFPRHLQRIRHAAAVPSAAHLAAVETQRLPSVLVDESFTILRIYGDTSGFLRIPAGDPTNNLLEIAEARLAPHLRAAAKHTLAGSSAFSVDVPAGEHGEPEVGLRVTRMHMGDDGRVSRFLVSFVGARKGTPRGSRPDAANEQWSDALRVSNDELDASREELQALNEELRASNEQLNTSNEDLNRSNIELERKIAQLEMRSRVLSSSAVATLFLDQDKRVRWFTPDVGELFPLSAGDEGRPLEDLAPRFDDPAFFDDIDVVLRTGQPREAEVAGRSGRWWLRRIHPFMSREHEIAGVAVIFTDITEGRHASQALEEDLKDTGVLRDLALREVGDDSLQSAYEDVLAAAVAIMRADAGSVQIVDEETGDLVLLAGHGISDEMRKRFFRLPNESLTSCGLALTTGGRTYIDFDDPGLPDPKGDLRVHLEHGLLSVQSTPLVSRAGKVIGMISTHWRRHHRASERELRFLDLLARQAADLIERTRVGNALRESERRYRELAQKRRE